jgi:hypothetical protein
VPDDDGPRGLPVSQRRAHAARAPRAPASCLVHRALKLQQQVEQEHVERQDQEQEQEEQEE